MSRVTNIQTAITVNPSVYSGGTNTYVTGGTSGCSSTSNTSTSRRATIRLRTSGQFVSYTFDLSDIPSTATIDSVACSARAQLSSNSRQGRLQLYTGTTAKGSQTTINSTASTVYNLTTGTWTRNELNNLSLRITNATGSTNSSYYIYFYGADLTVNYSLNGVEYEVTASSEYDGASATPLSQFIPQGDDAVVVIETDTLDNIVVEDNGTDVTEQLQYIIPSTTNVFTGVPVSYDATESTYDSIYTGSTNSGLSDHNSNDRICCYVEQTAYAEAKLTYNFDCSSIPQAATITSVSCIAAASCYSNGQYFDTKTIQLYSGSVAKGTAVENTGNGSTKTNHNINGGTWTRQELNDAKIVLYIKRGNNTTQASFSFWGATLTVNYTLPENPYYEYTLTNVNADHDVIIRQNIIVPEEEDPQKEYHSVTISSINATTEPGRGTTRVESGTNETITIYPSDPQLTLATDNGVDITSQLVAHGGTIQDPTVTTANGASYGFTLNSSTGYYTSANKGVDKSAAVCRVSFNLPVRCLVTINYINYAEATYDFGVFGNIDTALNTNYYAAGSGGATITDNDYKLACRTSSYNTSSVQTITYEVPSGEHYIDIKFSKDDATSSNNDTLQWKIASIEPLENNNYYTYTLNGINSDHSLVFIFGNVTYYFVNSSTDSESARLYPQGSVVYLPGDDYKLTVVPQNGTDSVSVYDNGMDVSGSLERKEITTVKDGVSSTTVNYNYHLYNIQATHNISVSVTPTGSAFLKNNGSWAKVTVYKKINGEWELQRIEDDIFDDGIIYINN